MNFGKKFLGLSAMALAGNAHSAGFEKSMIWSGKAVGQGGAVVGSVSGAESLYFNPAGLAHANGKRNTNAMIVAPTPEGTVGAGGPSDTNGEVSLNFSPTLSKFEGPAPFGPSAEGESQFSPVFGAVTSYQLAPGLGIGLGYYVAGGTKARFEDVGYTGLNANFDATKATVETNLAITEFALGLGYEIMPGLNFGASWRPTMVNADFSTVAYVQGAALLNVFVDDLEKTRWNGYRLGMQYAPVGANWGLGLAYRSNINFNAEGKSRGTVESQLVPGTTTTAIVGGDASIGNAFPEQATTGVFFQPSEPLRVALEYSFTHYSRDDRLNLAGNFTIPASAVAPGSPALNRSLTNITQAWKNQHVARVGSQYAFNEKTVGRLGYAWTSQVTADQFARSTFASPGSGHAVTIGAGHACWTNLDLDAAFEYSWAKGDGKNVELASTAAGTPGTVQQVPAQSEFKAHAYVLHLAATYRY